MGNSFFAHASPQNATVTDRVPRPLPVAAAVTTIGGALVAAGVLLPWLTLFAGLQRYTGLTGSNGRLLLAGGLAAVLVGIVSALRPSAALLRIVALLGAALVAFAAWLIIGLVETVHQFASNPMTLARFGPGLFVVALGAIAVTVAPALPAVVHARRG